VRRRDRAQFPVSARSISADDGLVPAQAVHAGAALCACAAGNRRIDDHPRAHACRFDTRPDGDDLAGDVHACDVRQFEQREQCRPVALQEIEPVQPDRRYAHQNLARRRLGVWYLGQLEHIGAAVRAVDRRSHAARRYPDCESTSIHRIAIRDSHRLY
jgi:hypothetical protein